MPLFFQLFLSKMKANFHRIAKATRNEVTPEDLKQDAWLIADEIGKKAVALSISLRSKIRSWL